MKIRTIECSGTRTVTTAAGGRIIVREDGNVEVMKLPTGRVSLTRNRNKTSLHFGSPTTTSLTIHGPAAELDPIFEHATGVKP